MYRYPRRGHAARRDATRTVPPIALLLLAACGGAPPGAQHPAPPPAASREPALPTEATSAPFAPGACGGARYRPPSGCYLDDEALMQRTFDEGDHATTIADAAALTSVLRSMPAVANLGTCDAAAVGAAFDFGRQRIWAGFIDGIGEMPGGLDPIRVECNGDEPVHIVIDVDRWCGGTEVGPGWMIVTVPAGSQPIELDNVGETECPPGPPTP